MLETSVTHPDVNNDGVNGFLYRRNDLIAYFDEHGGTLVASPTMSNNEFGALLQEMERVNNPLARQGKLPQFSDQSSI